MHLRPFSHLLDFLEKYGFFLLALFAVDLYAPDFSPKLALMELDLSSANSSRSSGNTTRQLYFISLFLGYLSCILRKASATRYFLSKKSSFRFFLPILALSFLSALWSEYALLSLKRSIFQCIVMFVTFFSVYFAIERSTFSRTITILTCLFLAASLFSLATGNGFVGNALTAWARSKNNYGAWILFVIFLLTMQLSLHEKEAQAHHYQRALRWFWVCQIPLIILLLLSGSKTSLALAAACLLGRNQMKASLKPIAYLTFVLLLCAFLFPAFFQDSFGESYNISRILSTDSLTGRSTIWGLLYTVFESPKNIFLGAGYGTFFNTGAPPEVLDIQHSYLRYLNSAHNGYLELALQFGVPMTISILSFMFLEIRQIKNRTCLIICWLVLLYNITESSLLRGQHIMWLIFIIAVSVDSSLQYKKTRAEAL